MVWREMGQPDFQPRGIGEFNNPLEELGSPPAAIRAVVQIDDQPLGLGENILALFPPRIESVAEEIAGVSAR